MNGGEWAERLLVITPRGSRWQRQDEPCRRWSPEKPADLANDLPRWPPRASDHRYYGDWTAEAGESNVFITEFAYNGLSTTTRFNVGAAGVLLGLAAAAWYVAASGIVGMGSMDISVPLYLATWLVMLVAMMFPAVAPIVVTFARVASVRADGGLAVAGQAFL